MITRRDVKTPIATAHCSFQFVPVAHIACNAFEIRARQSAHIARRAQQYLNAMPARVQLMHEIRADETRRSSDKTIHNICNGFQRSLNGGELKSFQAAALFSDT
jgi:hypothetical protein